MASHVRFASGCLVVACVGALASACGSSSDSSNETAQASGAESSGSSATAMNGAGASGTSSTSTEATPPPPPPPAMAHVRVIHASPDPALATVAVTLDGAASPTIPSLAYKAVQGYAEVPAAAHSIAVRPAGAAPTAAGAAATAGGAPASGTAAGGTATTASATAGAAAAAGQPVQAQTDPLAANHHYTVIAHGLTTGEPHVALATVEDSAEQPEAGHALVRFFHGLAGVGAVDVCMPGATARAAATAVFPNVGYGAWGQPEGGQGSYANVPAGAAVRLQVRAHNDRVCTGAVQGVVTVTPADRGVFTAIAVGKTGRPAVSKELLVCNDAPMTGPYHCDTVAIAAR